jgi:hypothetical protein
MGVPSEKFDHHVQNILEAAYAAADHVEWTFQTPEQEDRAGRTLLGIMELARHLQEMRA